MNDENIPEQWLPAFQHFIKTGEADDDFLRFLEENDDCRKAVERTFAEDAAALDQGFTALGDAPIVAPRSPWRSSRSALIVVAALLIAPIMFVYLSGKLEQSQREMREFALENTGLKEDASALHKEMIAGQKEQKEQLASHEERYEALTHEQQRVRDERDETRLQLKTVLVSHEEQLKTVLVSHEERYEALTHEQQRVRDERDEAKRELETLLASQERQGNARQAAWSRLVGQEGYESVATAFASDSQETWNQVMRTLVNGLDIERRASLPAGELVWASLPEGVPVWEGHYEGVVVMLPGAQDQLEFGIFQNGVVTFEGLSGPKPRGAEVQADRDRP